MFKTYFSDSDTYITDKIISGERKVSSSVGCAGTLDLYKLYGLSNTVSGNLQIPNVELSRALIHFNTEELQKLHDSGNIDISHSSFKCYLNLKDVYGGQPTPSKFTLTVYPLSRSFDEGFGKDIVYLTDYDAANFLSSSYNNSWFEPGADKGSGLEDLMGSDYITSGNLGGVISFERSQFFKEGTEDLTIDVTQIVSATLSRQMPDSGFRISFSGTEESDNLTYFVKRFASRHAYDSTLQPTLTAQFDDSLQDDTGKMRFSTPGNIFLYNYVNDTPANLFSGSNELSGTNCIKLTLKYPDNFGNLSLQFSGSQFSRGNWSLSGTYYANVQIDSTNQINEHLNKSGSLYFVPIWSSNDETITYLTGSAIKFLAPSTYLNPEPKKKYVVNVIGIPQKISRNEKSIARVNIFDASDPLLTFTRFPVETVGKIVNKCYYQIRDTDSGRIVVPFDDENFSTKVSSDAKGMYFYVDGGSVFSNRSYVIDVRIDVGNDAQVYEAVSTVFRVT